MAAVSVTRRHVLPLAALVAAYFLAGKLGLAVAFVHASATAVWPPTGIAIAALLLLGRGRWPAVAAGALLVNLTNGTSTFVSAGIAAGNTLEAVTGAWLVLRFADGRAALRRPQGVFRFAFLCAVATTVSATIGTLTLWLGGSAAAGRLPDIWLTWWLGDTVGALVFAPLVLLWARSGEPPATSRPGALETVSLALAVAAIGWIVFSRREPIAFACLPPLVWAALRFGRRVAATAAVALAGIALWFTLRGLGPFIVGSPNRSLLFLQTFIGIVALTALALAAAVRERQSAADSLSRARGELEDRVRERTASLAEAVDELGRSRAVLAEAQRVAHIGSWEWDVARDRVTWSDELYQIYGIEPGSIEVTYQAYLERVHADDREATSAAVRIALEGGGGFGFEERIVRPDGSVRVLQSKGYVVLDESNLPIRMIGTCHDITERKLVEIELARRMEALDRSNTELSMLSYAASHDLREPLRSVVGHVQLIARRLGGDGDPEIRRSIGFTVEAVRRMDELIEDLLEYSGADRPATRQAEAGPALAEALARLAPSIAETGARVESEDLPRVAIDPARLTRLFQNLVSNAVKYRSADAPPVVRIAARRFDDAWEFSVADNGRGFGPEDAERIFALFERLDPEAGAPGGTGLGLPICRRIVEGQGGRIWAESEPGRGSVFRFRLPLIPSAPPTVASG